MKKKKRKKSGVQTCDNCMHFDSKKGEEKNSCPYDDVKSDSEICKKFMSGDDYKELKTNTIKLNDKCSVKIIAYTWKEGDVKIKLLTIKKGQKGKEYVQKDVWPKPDIDGSIKLVVAIRKMCKELEE